MKLWPNTRAGLVCCALLSGCASAAFAQESRPPLDSILAEIEVSYDSAMWVVHVDTVDPALADSIQCQRAQLDRLADTATVPASEQDKRMERRWNTVLRLLAANLDSLAVLVRSPAVSTADLNPLQGANQEAGAANLAPLVAEVKGSVLESVLESLNPTFGAMIAHSKRLARFAAVSQLFDAFHLYRGRLLGLAEEACLERYRLCQVVDPEHDRPYWGVTVSGYSGDLYSFIGGFISISQLTGVNRKLGIGGRRAVIGGQLLTQFPEFREVAVEISVGSVFGDFVVMPGIIVSPSRNRAVELSGSVLYLPRSRLSLGLSYAVDHGFGVRAVYGFRPRRARLPQQPRPSR